VELIVASTARWQSKGHLDDMQRAMFKLFDQMEFGSRTRTRSTRAIWSYAVQLRDKIAGILLHAHSGSSVMISASIGACHCPTGLIHTNA
jgi:hypothetical protein